jgi:hypothetical protein
MTAPAQLVRLPAAHDDARFDSARDANSNDASVTSTARGGASSRMAGSSSAQSGQSRATQNTGGSSASRARNRSQNSANSRSASGSETAFGTETSFRSDRNAQASSLDAAGAKSTPSGDDDSGEDADSNFQSILRQFSSSQNDEDESSQTGADDGAGKTSGSDSGSAAPASLKIAGAATEIPPFTLAIPRTSLHAFSSTQPDEDDSAQTDADGTKKQSGSDSGSPAPASINQPPASLKIAGAAKEIPGFTLAIPRTPLHAFSSIQPDDDDSAQTDADGATKQSGSDSGSAAPASINQPPASLKIAGAATETLPFTLAIPRTSLHAFSSTQPDEDDSAQTDVDGATKQSGSDSGSPAPASINQPPASLKIAGAAKEIPGFTLAIPRTSLHAFSSTQPDEDDSAQTDADGAAKQSGSDSGSPALASINQPPASLKIARAAKETPRFTLAIPRTSLHAFSSTQPREDDSAQTDVDGATKQSMSDSGSPALASINQPLASMNQPVASMNQPLASMNQPLASINLPPASINPPLASIDQPLASFEFAGTAKENLPFTLAIPRTPDAIPPAAAPLTSTSRGAIATPLTATSLIATSLVTTSPIALDPTGTARDAASILTIPDSGKDSGEDSGKVSGKLSDDDERDPATATASTIEPASQVPSTAPAAHAGELAFAAKLIPATDNSAPETIDTATAPASAGFSNVQKSIPIAPQPTPAVSNATDTSSDKTGAAAAADPGLKLATAILADTIAAHASPASGVETASPAAPAAIDTRPAVARLEESIELPPAPPSSGSDITVRIADAERGTDVRFVERAGEVHVSVRTSDSAMAQTLRSGLNDFADRLEQGGIRTEMWRPASENGSESGSGSSSDSSYSENQPDRRSSGQRGSPQDSGSDQAEASDPDGKRDSNKPKWVEALEMSIGRQA